MINRLYGAQLCAEGTDYEEAVEQRFTDILSSQKEFNNIIGDALTDYEDDHWKDIRSIFCDLDAKHYAMATSPLRSTALHKGRFYDRICRELGDLIFQSAAKYIVEHADRQMDGHLDFDSDEF